MLKSVTVQVRSSLPLDIKPKVPIIKGMKEIQTTSILLQYCPFYPDMWVKMWVKNEIAVSTTRRISKWLHFHLIQNL